MWVCMTDYFMKSGLYIYWMWYFYIFIVFKCATLLFVSEESLGVPLDVFLRDEYNLKKFLNRTIVTYLFEIEVAKLN